MQMASKSPVAIDSLLCDHGHSAPRNSIDLCINNAIMGIREGNADAQIEGERRSVGRPAQASFGIAGFRSFAQRSGAAHPMPRQFGDALAGCPAARRSQGFAGALFSGTAAEAGPHATKTLGGFASARTARAWLSDQSVDDGAHCGTDPAGVPGSVSSRPCRPVDAPLAMEPAETGTARTGAG